MIKSILKYLLSPCILLLIGHGPMHARANRDRINDAFLKTLEVPAHAVVYNVQNSHGSGIEFVPAGAEKENYDLKALVLCDDTDDEPVSFKKHSGSSNYSTTSIFLAQAAGSFTRPCKKTLPFNNYISYNSFYRYLIFHTFRI